ncbi:TLC domain-containing protein 2 isoform X1 [Callorhinus ursinus]|uniref:TLC domain-containing protein 2 isoform X1 n=2 Tax=Callorhinus ursinus TaxID=34884 RepID=UPI003CD01777
MASWGLLVTGASFAAFRGLHWALQLLPAPGSAAHDRWKWRNICVSLLHSLLTGVGALLGLSLYPQMAADPIHGHPPWALVLVAVSVGYFLADGVDMLWNQTLRQAWELLCHHLVECCIWSFSEKGEAQCREWAWGMKAQEWKCADAAAAPEETASGPRLLLSRGRVILRPFRPQHKVSCFSTAILSSHCVGFSMVSLLLELNSACLHLRQLLLLSHQAPSLAFRMASWATLATLALFRLVPLGWMSLWLIRQQHQVPPPLVILGATGLVTVGALSITLGVRILVSDVLRSQPHPPIPGHKETRGTRRCRNGELVTRDDSTLSLKD